ncbi:MAG: helix-turn-helix domain-containing protein, partial [Myxococcales bacterium]|nr:helix-turn-helix domain-containing protein [Myxococcales bacterium]
MLRLSHGPRIPERRIASPRCHERIIREQSQQRLAAASGKLATGGGRTLRVSGQIDHFRLGCARTSQAVLPSPTPNEQDHAMDISIKEAADLLGKSQRTVRHMAQTGRIPARRIGSRWLIRQADAEAIKAGKDPMASFLDDEEADGPVSAASEAARPAAAPRPTFTISFDSSLEQSGDRSVHEITELRDLDTFAIASGLLAEVAYLRHDGPCDTMLLEHVEQSMCGILEVLADALQQHDPSSRVERFRQAQRQACSALTGLLHYNMVYAEP